MLLDQQFVQIPMNVDSDLAHALAAAFDITNSLLHHTPTSAPIRETVIRNILEAAKEGERDPLRLRDAGLAALLDRKVLTIEPIGTARAGLNHERIP
jgi:hypothetical protein